MPLSVTNPSITVLDNGNAIYSVQFDDVYHSKTGALAQAEHVFINGCQIQQAWHRQTNYCILESGFGLGINALSCWHNWLEDENRCKQLDFVSIEKYPLTKNQLSEILQQLPDYQQLKQPIETLLTSYPNIVLPGIHKLHFPFNKLGYGFNLTLAIGDICEILPQINCHADSLFLDGFSPTKNPLMWQLSTIKQLAKKLKSNATVASWCVAASVRNNLSQAGFIVQKRAGLPPKRHCLTARYLPWQQREQNTPQNINSVISTTHCNNNVEQRAIIIGAGIAGASMAWTLSQRGWNIQLIEQSSQVATAASAVPLALAAPHYSADDNIISQITRAGCIYLRQIIEQIKLPEKYWQQNGVLQIVKQTAKLPCYLPVNWAHTTTSATQQPAILWQQALHLDMSALVKCLFAKSNLSKIHWKTKVANIEQQDDGVWQITDQHHHNIAQAPVIIFANALSSLDFYPNITSSNYPKLQAIRGQMVFGKNNDKFIAEQLKYPINGNGHFIPALPTHNNWEWGMGSSFERDDTNCDIRHSSIDQNFLKLTFLSPSIAEQLSNQFSQYQLESFVQIRASSKDHLPLVGSLVDLTALSEINSSSWTMNNLPRHNGLFTLSAFGSRGACLAGICAELLASQLCQQPLPLAQHLINAIDPARYTLRQRENLFNLKS